MASNYTFDYTDPEDEAYLACENCIHDHDCKCLWSYGSEYCLMNREEESKQD